MEEQESLSYTKKKKNKTNAHGDDVMIMSHIEILAGKGDTYFQQLAILETAQRKNDKTKERLRLEFYSSCNVYASQSERERDRERQPAV